MSPPIHRLSALFVKSVRRAGYYADGDGLYLQVRESGAKSWIFRFTVLGKRRDMGLGSARVVTLAEAREDARQYRKLRDKGEDPIAIRKAERLAAQVKAAKSVTFACCAERYIASHRAGWKNPKYPTDWTNSLT